LSNEKMAYVGSCNCLVTEYGTTTATHTFGDIEQGWFGTSQKQFLMINHNLMLLRSQRCIIITQNRWYILFVF